MRRLGIGRDAGRKLPFEACKSRARRLELRGIAPAVILVTGSGGWLPARGLLKVRVGQLVTATPEPPARILALSGGGLLVWSWLRRR
jgi:hypothetical protein